MTRATRRLDAQRYSLAWPNAGVRVHAGLVMRARTGSDLQKDALKSQKNF